MTATTPLSGTPTGTGAGRPSGAAVEITIDGAPVAIAVPADTPLLWALRDAANRIAVKAGCVDQRCDACLVLADGVPITACRTSLRAVAGRDVRTVAGIDGPVIDQLRRSFAVSGAILCGHCTPAMLVAATALLRSDADPGDTAIDAAMTPLCRCGAYGAIRQAIRTTAAALRAVPARPSDERPVQPSLS